jgi:O-antigen/teichoic acid export membrane protein
LPELETTTPTAVDRERHFRTDHLQADLVGRSVRGGAVTMASQALKFALGLGSTVVLARLLTPKDYGLIGMVTAVTGFVIMFKDLGLSQATVQRDEITHEQISALFWLNVALSIGALGLTCALAPAIAWFYHEPRLTAITVGLAGAFIFSGLSVQHQALLQRQMRFGALAAIDIVAMVTGITVAIVMAAYGARYWALVANQVVMALVVASGVWIVCRWRPRLAIRRSGVRSLLSFGGYLTGSNVVNYVARNLDNVLIGWRWGAQPLGLYSRAYNLLLLPLRQINVPITAVAMPGLSRLQHDPARFRRYYLEALTLIISVTMPIIVPMILLSDELVLLVLGEQWRGAAVIFRLLGISALAQPICNTVGWLYMPTGRTERMFKWTIAGSLVCALAFAVGLHWGARGVALCYAVAMMLQLWPCMHYATRGLSISTRDIFGAALLPLVASVIAGAACFGLRLVVRAAFPLWATVLVCTAATLGVYAIVLLYVFGTSGRWLAILRELRRG